jgi:pyruvate,water dikinase
MAEVHDILTKRSPEDQERFLKTLECAQQVYPLKEDCEYFTFDAPTALMRYALLEVGNRLIRKRLLDHSDDIFFMELEELLVLFQDEKDAKDLVANRKAERAWIEAHPGPPSYGIEPQIPFNAYPPDIQLLLKGILWVKNEYYGFGQPLSEVTGTVLRGSAASPGRYIGPTRIIRNESEFVKLQGGDVLVCPITTPSWSVLFPTIGAIVTDAGGILSHPAIIAREYGVPAVVATKTATSLLRDGQIVTVDGSAGTVEIQS